MQKLDYNRKLTFEDFKLIKNVNYVSISSFEPQKYNFEEIYYIESQFGNIYLKLFGTSEENKNKNLLIFKVIKE